MSSKRTNRIMQNGVKCVAQHKQSLSLISSARRCTTAPVHVKKEENQTKKSIHRTAVVMYSIQLQAGVLCELCMIILLSLHDPRTSFFRMLIHLFL
jgi:hypothetical protein